MDTRPAFPRIGILGAGALGGFIGARLAAAGSRVSVVARGEVEVLRTRGWTVHLAEGTAFTARPEAVAADPAALGPQDLVIVALKTTRNALLPTLLPPLLQAGTVVLTLQNGLGNAEALAAVVGDPGRVTGGLCQIGVVREAPGVIRSFVPGGGFVQLGELIGGPTPRTEVLAGLLRDAGVTTRIVPSLGEALWRKLMWNVPYNGLTIAAGSVPTDQIVASAGLTALSLELMHELRRAAGRLGYPIEESYAEKLVHFTRGIGAYLPSTLIDFREGREVEIPAIFGEPLRQGTAAGEPMPHLATLHALLTALVAHRTGGHFK